MSARFVVLLTVALTTSCLVSIDESKLDDAGASTPEGGPTPSPFGEACGDGRICAVAPEGWSFVTVRSGTGGDCPSGYAALEPLFEQPASLPALTCTCECGAREPGGNPCGGPVLMVHGATAMCFGVATIAQGGCSPFTPELAGVTHVGVAGPLAIPKVACAGQGRETGARGALGPPSGVHVCAASEPPSIAACIAGSACVAKPSGPDALCVRGPAGATACPPRYPTMRRLGKSFRDERACGTCSCEANDQCAGKVELFTGGACTTLAATVTADGCPPSAATGPFTGAKSYTTVQPGACVPVKDKPVAVQGDVVADAPVLVCCP